MAAGSSFRRLWSWILIAILPAGFCLLPLNTERPPCVSSSSSISTSTSTSSSSSSLSSTSSFSLDVTEDDDFDDRTGTEIMIFLREDCDAERNVTEIQDFVDRFDFELRINLIPASLSCNGKTRGLDTLLRLLERKETKAIVAALDTPMCEITTKLARLWSVPFFTWTCPMKNLEEKEYTSIVRLSPSLPTIAKASAEMLIRLKWKSVSLIGTDREPWSSLDRALFHALRGVGVALRYRAILPYGAPVEQVRRILRPAYNVSPKLTVLCLPAFDDEFTTRVLVELDDSVRLYSNTAWSSMILIVRAEDDYLFLPEWKSSTSRSEPIATTTTTAAAAAAAATLSPTIVSLAGNSTFSDISYVSNASGRGRNETRTLSANVVSDASNDQRPRPEERTDGEREERAKKLGRNERFALLKNLSTAFLDKLLIITPLDRRYDVEKIHDGIEEYATPTLLDRLNETLDILMYDNYSSVNAFNNKMYTYVLLHWRIDFWKPIVIAEEEGGKLRVRKLSVDAMVAFRDANDTDFSSKCDTDVYESVDENCIDNSEDDETTFRVAQIVAIALGSLMLTMFAILLAILIRKKLLKKRMSKGPYKIVLTTSDFVFPQTPRPDSRRVDEGIETMLCCWLQQLQEFGGPEVEKPDLLQLGSVSSLKPYLRASNGNLARHGFFKDPRARYNGDLVQLKELPSQGTFELKGKAMDVLVVIHGLRHENLNPLIGCLNEPSRPCLVYEYCSRGSLEDVLMQDEIKLDWSFRLSLLTDLVRGMRYLHGTPIRVHGYLTSRNCVIDARWVLKVTDYGLPLFYEAQNMVPPTRMARDLLWTAPELLRHPNVRKKGTQAGDVYSFGIIMQEVVVRGEPFCMLALSPEDIIEKVMKPPPLIRPSVSKGAAPPEAINIMRQCWAEAADMRPDFDDVHDLFKKLNHGRKVNFVDTMFQMLEKYSNNLEELIRERTEQLDMEKKKTEQLLNRMLPSSVAEKLKLGMPVDPEEFRQVTIYFSDIVGFTTISAHSTPFQVVDLLNDLYTCFDATINAYNVYKVETIGDAYMVVGGCPVRIPDHASQIATMALDLLHQSGKFKLRHLPKTQLRLRIGLHTGPCCAGVVGSTMPRYCLFGDTVNTASRMESTGAPWRIHLSQATRDRLTQVGGYRIEYRGPTEIKGKGKMPTYWLLGKQGFDKELPTPPPLGESHGLNENLILESMTEVENVATRDNDGTLNQHLSRQDSIAEREEESNDRDVDDGNGNGNGNGNGDGDGDGDGGDQEGDDVETGDKTETRIVENVIKVSSEDVKRDGKIFESNSSPKSTTEFPTMMPPKEEIEGRGKNCVDLPFVTKRSSGDVQPSLGTSTIFCAETTTLAASTSSLASISSSATLSYRPGPTRHNRRIPGYIDENDLSTPYNRYRCLSPNEHYGRSSGTRFLKRQFSLDRPDEIACIGFTERSNDQRQQQEQQHRHHQQLLQQSNLKATPRLYKQNSAGAANDLERIEEIPSTPTRLLQHYRQAASVSLSVESLTLR